MQTSLPPHLFSLSHDDFNNLSHYKIYKRLIKLIEKNKNVKLVKTENYVVIIIIRGFDIDHYIIGLDRSTNKYFINKIEFDDIIRIEKDSDIFNLLYYDYDCDLENINEICTNGRYRVQGDLILIVRSADDFLERLFHSIKTRLYRILDDIVIARISNLIVSAMHLNVTVNVNHVHIRTDDKKLKKYTKQQLENMMVNMLYELLNEYHEILFSDIIAFLLNNQNVDVKLRIYKRKHEIIVECDVMKVILSIYVNDLYTIEINISNDFNFDNIIYNVLDSLEFTRHETMFGRHKIIFENVIPNNLQLMIKLNLREIDQIILDINTLNRIFVRGKIIIMHPEHNVKEIVLCDTKTVSIDSVRNDLDREMNSYTLLSLLKKSNV